MSETTSTMSAEKSRDSRPSPARKKKSSAVVLASFFATKFMKILKVFKAIKVLKLFITLFSMALSVFVYSFQYGLRFAIGLVLLLFIHEMGHVFAVMRKGHPASAPVFIPMLGAVIFAPKFKTADEEAFIGYGGPFLGALSAFALYGLWLYVPGHPELLLLMSYFAAFLNLFNLIPISPLDGGRVTKAIGKWFKYIGFALLGGFTLYSGDPGLLIIWILSVDEFGLSQTKQFHVSVGIWTVMCVLLACDYGNESLLGIFLHTSIAGLFVVLRGYQLERARKFAAANEPEEVAEKEPSLPLPSPGVRVRWFALYIGLIVALGGLMMVQAPHLPHAIQEQHR